MLKYNLEPANGRKSFYGKAYVIEDDGVKTLYSYGTKIMSKKSNGDLVRHWTGWTTTTGNHIKSFCGLNKKEFNQLEYTLEPKEGRKSSYGIDEVLYD